MKLFSGLIAAAALLSGPAFAADPPARSAPQWDTYSDTWVATDALNRSLPTFEEVGPPRRDRTVGMFYFLWHGPHVKGGPYDITQILARDPDALQKPDSPLWGPLHAMHHWGQPLFGYYLTDDRYVLRKHAQMLSDAGVDSIIFDASNQQTYPKWHTPLMETFTAFQRNGGTPPRFTFLAPFWDPARVVAELYRDLYAPGRFADLWFRWEGKPLILADPALSRVTIGTKNLENLVPVELKAGETLGQTFSANRAINAIGGRIPTWHDPNASVTLSLRQGGPKGKVLQRRRFARVADNAWLFLDFPRPLPAGAYYLEMSEPKGRIGWWTHGSSNVFPGSDTAFRNGVPDPDAPGDRTVQAAVADKAEGWMQSFFTFRAPQADYFAGATQPEMWSWLETYPQQVFRNRKGEKEQMSVGVGQNAVRGKLGGMSDPGAQGRSFHDGRQDTRPGAVQRGLNFAEQFERALQEDPRFVFITGWNEWTAMRFPGKPETTPVTFVDQFTQEFSRDIEPMASGGSSHGDNYYYQMVAFIRRYKGVRPLPAVTPKPITIDGKFDDWKTVGPEFRDTIGDPAKRSHPAWNNVTTYTNTTGRSDLVAAKVSYDAASVYFYLRAREPLQSATSLDGMRLYLDTDKNAATGWMGYDFVVSRLSSTGETAVIERNEGGKYAWDSTQSVSLRVSGSEIEIAIPRTALGIVALPATLDFKWADNCFEKGDWTDFTLNGDAAPNDRFNYRAKMVASPVR